jgi:DNA primase
MQRRSRSPSDDAAFRRAVDEAKAKYNISDVVARTRKVTRAGREKKALCPFHDEKSPSFQLNDAKGTFYCFGCGAAGDLVSYVMHVERCGFMDAVRWLGMAALPAVDPAQRAQAAAEDAADRAAAIADARMMWGRCVDPVGTLAERYLREARGINMTLPPAVRFGIVPTSRDDNGRWKRPYPAAVFSVVDGAGDIVGLQRVFLTDDGLGKRWGKRSKLSLGRPRGSAVRLQAGTSGDVVICEGPEDGLTLAQEMPDRTVWVALGTAMMPEIQYPPSLSALTIAGQNDAPGRAAVEKARTALDARGIAVRLMYPDPLYKDWNDQLRGIFA